MTTALARAAGPAEGEIVLTAKGVQTHSSNQLHLNNSVHSAQLHAAIKAKKPLKAPHETK